MMQHYEWDVNLIASRIKKLRNEAKISQATLAKETNANRATVIRWEKGDCIPLLEFVYAMCELFNCDADYILGKIDTKTREAADIGAVTGLSESSIEFLKNLGDDYDNILVTVNLLLDPQYGSNVLKKINKYFNIHMDGVRFSVWDERINKFKEFSNITFGESIQESIENSLLFEVQYALKQLKEKEKENLKNSLETKMKEKIKKLETEYMAQRGINIEGLFDEKNDKNVDFFETEEGFKYLKEISTGPENKKNGVDDSEH